MRWSMGRDPRVRDEIRFHRDRLIDEYVAAGLERGEAERRAFLEFGSVAQIEEACRDARGRWLDDAAKDLRYAIRALCRNPGFAVVAVLSLALGIGANAAIFTLVNAVMLRKLPVPQPDRLVQITRFLEGQPGYASYPLFEQLRDNVKSISGAFAQETADQAIVIGSEEDFVAVDIVSAAYFTVLGVEPAAGRLLHASDDVPASGPVAAVMTDRYWSRRFGRSPSAIGQAFTIREHTFAIVGVTPPGFDGARRGRAPDLIVPLSPMMNYMQRRAMDFNSLNVLARLKPGATVEQANAETQVLFSAFVQSQASRAGAKERPVILRQRAGAVYAPDGFNPIRYAIAQPLLILMGIVALILTLACVNLAGLLLARAAAREREISIRLAIGAGWGRIARQFLAESLVLSVLGGSAGLAIAGWLSARLFTMFVNGRDVVLSIAPDWRVVAFTCAVSLAACCIAGLVPAWQAARASLNAGLKQERMGRRTLGKALVVAQLAISMVLVVGATLFVGTLVNLYAVDRGFDSDGLLVVNIRTARPYPAGRVLAVQRSFLDHLKRLPGVLSVSAAQMLPVGGNLWDRTVQVEGYTFRPDEAETVGFNVIAPQYFATFGTPLVHGREFTDRDVETSPKVAIVNERFARRFFGNGSAVGRRVSSVNVTYEIVGVVGDAKYQTLRDRTIDTMFIPWTQREPEQPSRYSYLVRVASGNPMRLASLLDTAARVSDPALRIRTALSYATLVDRSIATERIMATLGGLFGVLALLVAALGMFGVLAFHVARRTNELGVRIALGASRPKIMALVLRDVIAMVIAGISLGAAGAVVVSGATRRILFGLTPNDPAAFAVAAAILACAAILAGSLPAHRASRVDPLVALRHE